MEVHERPYEPHNAIFTYGSLLSICELNKTFSDGYTVVPVIVDGLQRRGKEKSEWRGDNPKDAVFRVDKKEDFKTNGLLILDYSKSDWEEFRKRERGYLFESISGHHISPYNEDEISKPGDVDVSFNIPEEYSVITSFGNNPVYDGRIIRSYLRLCASGAREWGETFFCDFLKYTKI